mmetsp:Transcript_97143/g.169580  ORF Transcript_97143/g.169580 Transcript_97143/m.169580 type:complete len:97 (+) Transcript_97143:83-373(+)
MGTSLLRNAPVTAVVFGPSSCSSSEDATCPAFASKGDGEVFIGLLADLHPKPEVDPEEAHGKCMEECAARGEPVSSPMQPKVLEMQPKVLGISAEE